MDNRGTAPQNFGAARVSNNNNLKSIHDCAMVGRVQKEKEKQNISENFESLPCAMVAEENFFESMTCVMDSRISAPQILEATGKNTNENLGNTSNNFMVCDCALGAEQAKMTCGEASEQGQASSEEGILSAGMVDTHDNIKDNNEGSPKKGSEGGGSQPPKPPCKGFMQKCREMVVGYLAPSTSSPKNDQESPEAEKEIKDTGEEDPEPNLGEGEASVRGSEPQISPLSSENQRSQGERNAERTPVFRNAFDFEDEDPPPNFPPQAGELKWPAGSMIFQEGKNSILPEGGGQENRVSCKKETQRFGNFQELGTRNT